MEGVGKGDQEWSGEQRRGKEGDHIRGKSGLFGGSEGIGKWWKRKDGSERKWGNKQRAERRECEEGVDGTRRKEEYCTRSGEEEEESKGPLKKGSANGRIGEEMMMGK